MNRWLNRKLIYIVPIIVALTLVIFLLVRSCSPERPLQAELTPGNPVVGETVYFRDSTAGAGSWFWEFGNGDESRKSSGNYVFTKSGKYQVRLTVDGRREKYFLVEVREATRTSGMELAAISGPAIAMQGEYITFKGIGTDKQWRWEFGESGMVDSREKNPVYAYNTPGVYEVMLSTENTRYPVRHRIEVVARYMENDTTDAMTLIGNDIREHLQAIADGRSFNSNFNYILNKYLCGNSRAVVVINNNRYNDFYSFCQGLHLIGRRVTHIETVIPEISEPESGCVDKILVLQTENPQR